MKEFIKLEKVLANYLAELYALMYKEKIDIEDPSEEEKFIIFQYRLIGIIHNAVKEVLKNEKSSKQNGK